MCIFSIHLKGRWKRQADEHENETQNHFAHHPEVCALGLHDNGSAFAVSFQNVSEFKVCIQLRCIPSPRFQIQHVAKEECEDAFDGVPTCVLFTNFFGLRKISHCNLPVKWGDHFPTRQTYAELEYCGIDISPILQLPQYVKFYQFQKASDCEHLDWGMHLDFPTPTSFISPFDMKIGVCTFIFYTNFTYNTEWCAIPSGSFSLESSQQCNQPPVTEDIKLWGRTNHVSKHECASAKLLEVAYKYRREEDSDGLSRWCFKTTLL